MSNTNASNRKVLSSADYDSDSINKRKQLILDCIEKNDFKTSYEHSKELISKRGKLENVFRIGTKILSLISSISKKDQLSSCYDLFREWFDYCLDFQQNLLTRNNLIYFGISYTKNLLTEKIYDVSLIMLDRIQEVFGFVCDMPPDPDNERYLKYMAPLSYNSSLKKEILNEDPETSMKLYVHGIKFYLKYQSNFYILLDSIRSIEISFVKFNLVEKFYTNFFDFVQSSLSNSTSLSSMPSTPSSKRTELIPLKSKTDSLMSKQIYLIKFYTALYLQYVSICFNSHLNKEKSMLKSELTTLQSYFLNETLYGQMKKLDADVRLVPRVLSTFEKIFLYLCQYQKEVKSKMKQKNVEFLKENMQLELKLDKSLYELYVDIVEKSDNYYQTWLFTYLFEILVNGNSSVYNDSTVNASFFQDSQIELLINATILQSKTIKKYYSLHHQPEKIARSIVIKVINSFLSCERLVEQSFKINNDKKKWINSENGADLTEKLLVEHGHFIKWVFEVNLITAEEVGRIYYTLEHQTIRLCSSLYADENLVNYIRFQKLSSLIAMEKLKFHFNLDENHTYLDDYNKLKSYRNICDNLLLSLRLKEKFDDAFDTLKHIYEFLSSYNLEQNEIEWVVTIWCKIKRDLWKAKLRTYQKITIADYLNIKSELVDKYLLEEVRIYNCFKFLDVTVQMNDEIYYTLEKLENLPNTNSLLKSRILIEIAQFTWCNFKDSNNKFKLSTEEYIKKAQLFLNNHQCLKKDLNMLTNEIKLFHINDDYKENDVIVLSPPPKLHKTPTKTTLSTPLSPTNINEQAVTTAKKTGKQALIRKRKLQSTRSPLISKTNSPILTNTKHTKCDCVLSQILQFQLDLYKSLSEYAKFRSIMTQNVTNLIQSRSKVKENVTTNADQIQVQSMSSSCIICAELCDESSLKMSDDQILLLLDSSFIILERLSRDSASREQFITEDRSIKKQFYESVDLLAQLYGFFGLLTKRIQIFNFKLDLLSAEFEYAPEFAQVDFETTYTNCVLQLMKVYLNANMCDEFAQLLLKEKINVDNGKQPSEEDELSASNKKNAKNLKKPTVKHSVSPSGISFQELDTIDQNNKILLGKPENQIVYHLTIAHYFILKRKTEDALKLIKSKIITSSILNGKQTAYYYEIKYYLKYLQFILSISNLGKNESKFNEMIENETPLSLLEDCYTSSFSVARYYLQSSFEPRTLSDTNNNNKKNEDQIYFNIGNSECYRILTESLDIMQETCRYYIEISRYRDALAHIREGLDITQLHFSKRRIGMFLLHQINTDLVACCLNEASSRLSIAQNLIGTVPDFKETQNDLNFANDLTMFRNYFYYKNLKFIQDIKLYEQQTEQLTIDFSTSIDNLNTIHNFLNECKRLGDYCINLTVENYFIMSNHLKAASTSKSAKESLSLIKKLKEVLLKSAESKPISMNEKWNLAQFFCLSYELDPTNLTNLATAYSLIKSNPHPLLYRRICLHLFESESLNNKLKIEYLLETQSIALRHKACSIQIKNKRKSLIDSNQFERITSSLVFNNKFSLYDKIEKMLPNNFVVVSLVLVDFSTLYAVRLESGNEPFYYRLKYDRKYTEEFKQIIAENDRSMKQSDRNKFWSTRSQLNSRLAAFTEEIEKNVLSYAKALLLGSFKEFNLDKFIERIKSELSLVNLTKSQTNLLKLIVGGLEYLDSKLIRQGLKTEFDDAKLDTITNYLVDRKAKLSGLKRKHVCLLVDKHLHQIPWESLPSAKKQSITRMPSIHFLLSHLKVNKLSINKENAFYIVDPGGDLVYTKQKFQPFFEKKKTWKGLVGVAPDETQFKTALTEYELFIYTGHGSGSQYYPSDEVQKLRIQACSILMGCSSGNQYVLGDFEPYGTVLAYIIAGCPCIVGNLWDVTDRDIDRLTEEFLETWLKDHDEANQHATEDHQTPENAICLSLNKARNGCKMTFLNGSAPIVYGLPVDLNTK